MASRTPLTSDSVKNATDEMREDEANRAEMIPMYQLADKLLESFPKRFKDDLETVFPEYIKKIRHNTEQMKKGECVIFVAGEPGSGKSTLINLLVGMDLLPTHTMTLCELRWSKTRSIILHHKDGSVKSKKLECKDDSRSESFQKNLKDFITRIDKDTGQSPYEKIEINWTFPTMQKGVVFVDSPGIGGSCSVDIEKYLKKTLGFIYVINAGDAGGISKDRIDRLLRTTMINKDSDPSASIFVCNKWGQVDAREETRRKSVIKENLKQCIPAMQDNKLFTISASRALEKMNHGMAEDHTRLVHGIQRTRPIIMRTNLVAYYRWLSQVLKRARYSLKASRQLQSQTAEEKKKLHKDVSLQIDKLETRANEKIRDMKKSLETSIAEIVGYVSEVLKRCLTRDDILTWNPSECPGSDSAKKVIPVASSAISNRIQDTIDTWEAENGVVTLVRRNIIRSFERDVKLFPDQVKQIEGVLLEDAKPVAKSLGSSIVGTTSLSTKKKETKTLFKSYNGSEHQQIMQKATILFLKELIASNLTPSVAKYFERLSQNIDKVGRMLPDFLRADRQLMKSLVQDLTDIVNERDHILPNLISRTEDLQGQVDLFFAAKLMTYDFAFEELDARRSGQPIGRGSFADVYFSKLMSPEGHIPIALKICKFTLAKENVTDVILEDSILRGLDHKNIVRYYGASRQVGGRGIYWVMVLEYCASTLKERIVGDKANSPAKHENIKSLQIDAMKSVAVLAEQICCGLEYVHGKGVVHRDIKPENILLTDTGVVKLADVGLAKREKDIAGTVAGSPMYMAPEVLLETGQYGVKADMYSMGIMLWEMWYGLDAAKHTESRLGRGKTFEKAVEDGMRPLLPPESGKQPPAPQWKLIMIRCWDSTPERRHSSTDVRQFFLKFLNDNKD